MKTKAVLTLILTTIYLFLVKAYHAIQGSFESQVAVQQLEDNPYSYSLSNFILESNIYSVMHIVFIGILALIWIPTIKKYIKTKMN